jgi:membrane associated rhomboid family serine protease
MIPIKDNLSLRRLPVVTISLIILNILIFFYELTLGPNLINFFQHYAIIPANFFAGQQIDLFGHIQKFKLIELYLPLLTSMFLHGGWLHISINMLYLWIFGDNIEDRLGSLKFLFFYLACGLVAACAHLIMNSDSTAPSLGASGAIAGVLGAYILLFPRARVLTILPFLFFLQFFEIPAFFFIGIWILQQFLAGAITLAAATQEAGGIAWWAHIGGFFAGCAFVILIRPSILRLMRQRRAIKPKRPSSETLYWPAANSVYPINRAQY